MCSMREIEDEGREQYEAYLLEKHGPSDQAEEQVKGLIDILEGDPEAQLRELENLMDNFPEGHPLSNAAYKIAEERNLI